MKKNNKKLILFIFMISIVILVLWGVMSIRIR